MNPCRLILLSVFTVTLLAGCSRKASDEIDFGTVENSTYRNEYFGFTVTFPDDWSIQDQEAQREIMQLGADMFTGDDQNLKAAMKASELTTVNLLAVFEKPVGSPVFFNPNILSLAERVRGTPGIRTGKDYLFHLKQAMGTGQVQYHFPEDTYTETLGTMEFDVLKGEMPLGEITIYQKYYVQVMKGYALGFILSYLDKDQEAALEEILKTVTFE